MRPLELAALVNGDQHERERALSSMRKALDIHGSRVHEARRTASEAQEAVDALNKAIETLENRRAKK